MAQEKEWARRLVYLNKGSPHSAEQFHPLPTISVGGKSNSSTNWRTVIKNDNKTLFESRQGPLITAPRGVNLAYAYVYASILRSYKGIKDWVGSNLEINKYCNSFSFPFFLIINVLYQLVFNVNDI